MNRRRMSPWLLPVAAIAVGAVAPSALAQPTTFEGTAVVPLSGPDDLVKARTQAHADAFARAVEQAVAELIPEGRSRLYLILGRAREYVLNYRVLQEGEVAGQFQVRIAAQIDVLRLGRDLQAPTGATSPAGPVRPLYVCVPPSDSGLGAALEAARAFLIRSAGPVEILPTARCTEPPDPALLRSATALLVLSQASPPDARSADASPDPIRGTQPPLFGHVARVQWRAHRSSPGAGTSSSDVLREQAESTAFAPSLAAATDESQRTAALQALQALLARPGVLLGGASAGTGTVTVSIEGLRSHGSYQQLLRVLASLPGVSRVEPRRFFTPLRRPPEGTAEPTAGLLLYTATPVETLGAALGRVALSGMRLQVAPQGPAELRVLCAPEGALPTAQPEPDAPDAPETEKLQ